MKTKFSNYSFPIWSLGLLLIGLSFKSCIPEPLNIEVPQLESKIVVSSQVIPPDVLLVSLSQSFSALADIEDDSTGELLDQLLLKNSEVVLEYDGRIDTLIEINNGFYAGLNLEALVGRSYQLRVKDTLGRQVSSQTVLLEPMGFQEIDIEVERLAEDTITRIEYTLQDLPGNNWYMINYYATNSREDTTLSVGNLLSGARENGYLGTDLISDQEFAPDGSYKDQRFLFNLNDSSVVAISIANISEEYYQYLVLREQAGNLFSQIVSEPINYPSNIEGGLGFFTLHYPRFRFFAVADF